MKRIIIAIALTTIFSACAASINVQKDLTQEQRTQYEEQISSSMQVINNDSADESDRMDALQQIAVNNQLLGNYDQAVIYFDKILEQDENNYTALNNLASIYEEIGDNDLAADYIKRLYELHQSKQQVVRDIIRILIKNNQIEEAQQILNSYASEYQTPETTPFISEQFEIIMAARKS